MSIFTKNLVNISFILSSLLLSSAAVNAACPDFTSVCIKENGEPVGPDFVINSMGRGIFRTQCTFCTKEDRCGQTIEKFRIQCFHMRAYLPIRPNSWLEGEQLLMDADTTRKIYAHPKDFFGREYLKPIPWHSVKKFPKVPTGIEPPKDPTAPPQTHAEVVRLQ